MGRLDLEYCDLGFPLRFGTTTFGTNPVLRYCRVEALEFVGCSLPSFDADGIQVAFDFTFRSTAVGWDVQLNGATVGRDLVLAGTTVGMEARGTEGRTAISAEGIQVGGSLRMEDDPKAAGQIRLHGARIASQLNCRGAALVAPMPLPALVADRAEIGSVFIHRGFSASGAVRLVGARIDGQLNCGDATLMSDVEPALWLERATIGGGVFLQRGFSADGEVKLTGSRLGGPLHCENSTLRGGWDSALSADASEIDGPVVFKTGFDVTGEVSLAGARINGALDCRGARMANLGGTAVSARYAEIRGPLILRNVEIAGGLDLYKASASSLDDDLGEGEDGRGSWRGLDSLVLEGFEYERFADDSTWDANLRFRWLGETTTFEPGAWRRLSEVFQADGRDDDARRALIGMQNDRLRRAGLPPHRKIGRWILGVTVGHGYRPWLAGVWALAIVLLFALIVWQFPDGFTPEDTQSGSPQPVVYAADTFLPVIDFGEADRWTAVSMMRWAEWLVVLLGWGLTTIFVAGFTRIVRT